jgi:exonuclease III
VTAGSDRKYRTAIAWRGDRISANPRKLGSIGGSPRDALPVSRVGTLTAVDVELRDGPVTLISAYAFWERPCGAKNRPIYADASAHRIISDISGFLETHLKHRIIVAGDFNIFHGHGDRGSRYWKERYASVFTRFELLGLTFIGPQFPDGGRQADPWPSTLPADSRNVPTFYSSRQSPASATWQLDFVFASCVIANRIRVRAINAPEDWGPSDHCRVEILVDE